MQVNRFLWLDLEMTGLDWRQDKIIECAALVVDRNFKILDRFESAIFQQPDVLAKMDAWNQEHHGKSGLLSRIPQGMPEREVEGELLRLIRVHWAGESERPILCGNSIMQDRLFIMQHWPALHEKLHYRMLDVSSFKIVFQNLYGKKYDKKNAHRALDDIQESIGELQFYLSFFK